MTIKPTRARYRVAEKNNSLYILFKQPFSFITFVSSVSVLVVFVIILINMIYIFLDQGDLSGQEISTMTFIWVTTLIFAVSIGRSFCRIFGSELIEINESKLSVINRCFKWKRVKSFDVSHIRNLHAGTKGKVIKSKILGFSKVDNGVVFFDYGAETYSIGFKLSEPEIRDLIYRIKKFANISESNELDVPSMEIDDNLNIQEETKEEGDVSLKNILRHG